MSVNGLGRGFCMVLEVGEIVNSRKVTARAETAGSGSEDRLEREDDP